MRHIKTYRVFEAEPASIALTEDQKVWLDECTTGIWNLNSSTGLVDVDGDFDCCSQGLKELKGVKFGKVSGSFYCYENQLTTLAGAPQTVDGNFNCDQNQLTTLVGAPQTVSGNFDCYGNQLTTLEGAPQTVKGSFYCDGNPVSEETLKSIFSLMKNGKSYQQALEEYWPKMGDEDRALMYKDHSSLSPEETRKYKALATYGNIKGYL